MLDDVRAEKIVDKYSFKNQTKREPGTQDDGAYLRKGITGDWKSHFSKQDRELFAEMSGNELLLTGYESDGSWVSG